jgi:hypothetical protein
MAKKRTVNKSQAVRDYMKAHPTATSGEIAAALKKQGIKIAPNYAANLKSKIGKNGNGKKKPAKKEAPALEAPAAPVAKAANTVTVEQVRAVTQTVKLVGGANRLNELLGLVREVGGVKKFKDLLDAMTVTEDDVINF